MKDKQLKDDRFGKIIKQWKDISQDFRLGFKAGQDAQRKKDLDEIDKLKHTGWVSKDLLYDNLKEEEREEEICVCDIEEIKKKLEDKG